MSVTEERVAELEARLRRVEDEQAIRRTLVRYGFAVDRGDAEATGCLYTDDCVIELDYDGGRTLRGRDGARDLVNDPVHQALLPHCAHLIGPMAVVVEGDRAVATGYAMVVLRSGDAFAIWRQGCGRWELVRQGDEWRISRRTSIAVGSPAAQALLAGGL